ncbi:Uncharacterised protein [[Clostridium] sordellii]|nr:Uncharacterised protein [[Clostridium] sordellii] [Paeniclostridium sordellii]
MIIKLQYILLFIITLSTIYSLCVGDSYTKTGILGIIFLISCIINSKSETKNIIINLTIWLSSIIIVISFVL